MYCYGLFISRVFDLRQQKKCKMVISSETELQPMIIEWATLIQSCSVPMLNYNIENRAGPDSVFLSISEKAPGYDARLKEKRTEWKRSTEKSSWRWRGI
jgi:hypothetical protein